MKSEEQLFWHCQCDPLFLGEPQLPSPPSAIGKGSYSPSSSPFHFNCCWCGESLWKKRLCSLLTARKQTSVWLYKYKHFRVIRRSALKLINNIVWIALFGLIYPDMDMWLQCEPAGVSSLWCRAGLPNQVAELLRKDPTCCPKECSGHLYWPVDSEPNQQISSFYQP